MKKILIAGVVFVLVVPQIAMASWWNPFTWRIFSRPAEVRVEQPNDVSVESKKATTTVTSTAKIIQMKETISKDNKESVISSSKKQSIETKNQITHQPPQEQPNQTTQNITQVSFSQQQTAKISNSDLSDALDEYRGQLILDFVKTSAPRLANIAGLIAAQFDILQNGRDRCAKDYDEMIEVARQRYEYVAGSNEKYIKDLMADKEYCMSGYPQVDLAIPSRIDQAMLQLDTLYRKAYDTSTSPSEINSILQEYNSIEAQVYSFKDSIPSFATRVNLPIQSKAPSSSDPYSCSFSFTGSSYSCRSSSGVSTNCSIAPSGGSLSCASSNGENINCSISPSGNGVNCF